MHSGNSTGPGLTNRPLGQRGGSETNTLSTANMPNHNHAATTTTTIHIHDDDGVSPDADGAVLANSNNSSNIYSSGAIDGALGGAAATSATTVGNTGANQSINNMMPFLAINYIIALQGIFPSRN